MTAAPPPRGWLLRTWGEEAVVYDTASGDTHYLAPFSRVLYETCSAHPGLTAAEIAALLTPQQPEPEFVAAIDEGLASLHRIGLLHTP